MRIVLASKKKIPEHDTFGWTKLVSVHRAEKNISTRGNVSDVFFMTLTIQFPVPKLFREDI